MHDEDIKATIRKQFRTVSAFEIAKGLARASVRDVLRGRTTRRTAVAIAEAVGQPVEELFPGRFGQASIRREYKSRKRDVHRLNDGRA